MIIDKDAWNKTDDGWFTFYVCPNCGHKEMQQPDTCPACGKKLKRCETGKG